MTKDAMAQQPPEMTDALHRIAYGTPANRADQEGAEVFALLSGLHNKLPL